MPSIFWISTEVKSGLEDFKLSISLSSRLYLSSFSFISSLSFKISVWTWEELWVFVVERILSKRCIYESFSFSRISFSIFNLLISMSLFKYFYFSSSWASSAFLTASLR